MLESIDRSISQPRKHFILCLTPLTNCAHLWQHDMVVTSTPKFKGPAQSSFHLAFRFGNSPTYIAQKLLHALSNSHHCLFFNTQIEASMEERKKNNNNFCFNFCRFIWDVILRNICVWPSSSSLFIVPLKVPSGTLHKGATIVNIMLKICVCNAAVWSRGPNWNWTKNRRKHYFCSNCNLTETWLSLRSYTEKKK